MRGKDNSTCRASPCALWGRIIVGDHATYHVRYDAQLQSDIETVARNVSTWVRTVKSPQTLCTDTAEAIAVSQGAPRQIATLIVPADVSWSEGAQVAPVQPVPARPQVSPDRLQAIAGVLSAHPGKTLILLGGAALYGEGLELAARIAAHRGVRLLAEVFPARIARGAGLPHVERLAYFAEMAAVQLRGVRHLILVDAKSPVSFFAYLGKKSDLLPSGCEVHELARLDEDAIASLRALAERLGAMNQAPQLQAPQRPPLPQAHLSAEKTCQIIAHLLPERAIIVDEAQTSGVSLPMWSAGAPAHDVLTLTGGAIGQGLPLAVGAAIACPDRPVLALIGDGAAMYTLQALWTLARERLNVTTLILNNRSYAILNVELQRVGAVAGAKSAEKARAQLDLQQPALDFVHLGQGMGVDSVRVRTCEDLIRELERCLATPGPHLIEALIPNEFTGIKLKLLPHLLRHLEHLPRPWAQAIKRKVAP